MGINTNANYIIRWIVFLASFSKFILKHSDNDFISGLIKKSFIDLFEKHITKYEHFDKVKIRITGSIGFFFNTYIKEVAKEYNSTIDLIVKEPIQRLAEYHINLL